MRLGFEPQGWDFKFEAKVGAAQKLMLSGSAINKAGCIATPVPCGWTGATFVVTKAFGQEKAKNLINTKKVKCDRMKD